MTMYRYFRGMKRNIKYNTILGIILVAIALLLQWLGII